MSKEGKTTYWFSARTRPPWGTLLMEVVRTVRHPPPTRAKSLSHRGTCKGKACLPLSQGFLESQGGQGCLEGPLPQGSPKEAKMSGQEEALPYAPGLLEEPRTPQVPKCSWGGAVGQRSHPSELSGASSWAQGQ